VQKPARYSRRLARSRGLEGGHSTADVQLGQIGSERIGRQSARDCLSLPAVLAGSTKINATVFLHAGPRPQRAIRYRVRDWNECVPYGREARPKVQVHLRSHR